jgi:hypothetical protein
LIGSPTNLKRRRESAADRIKKATAKSSAAFLFPIPVPVGRHGREESTVKASDREQTLPQYTADVAVGSCMDGARGARGFLIINEASGAVLCSAFECGRLAAGPDVIR